MEKSQPQLNKDGCVKPETNVGVEEAGADTAVEYKDYRSLFMTNKVFGSREEAVNWVKETGKENNMFFTITTSRPIWTYIGCERSGKPIAHKHREGAISRKSSGSKKINCPFQVKLQKKEADNVWVVRIDRNKGRHNHDLGLFLKAQSSAKKAKRDDEENTLRQFADDRARAVELFNEACRVFKETASTGDLLLATKTLSEIGQVLRDIGEDEPNEY